MNMKQTSFSILTGIYALIMTIILFVSVFALVGVQSYAQNRTATEVPKPTYIYVTQESSFSESVEEEEQEEWIMQSYNNQIGIFQADGTLLRILDTYVKTLPKADQVLLEEGIHIKNKKELYALIEDYSD